MLALSKKRPILNMGLILVSSMSWTLFQFMHVVAVVFVLMGCSCSGGSGSSTHRHRVHVAGNETDRLALLAFKAEITGDPFRALNSWNESIHFCQWAGITCGRRHQRVTKLNLDHQKLTGSISPHIGNLSFLRKLFLRNNSFTHQIPPELGHLRRLQILTLRNNSIGGEIPANISAYSNLVALVLSGNTLAGKIPVELGSLSKLVQLSIEKNNLTGGLPYSFGNLSSLIEFDVSVNNINGSIPEALGRLTNLHVLTLGENKLVGTIPSSIFNLTSITIFDIGMNQVQGRLPLDLGSSLPALQWFSVGSNLFTGFIPISISNATHLFVLDFGTNKFIGRVPPLGMMHNLMWLNFEYNHLGTGEAGDLNFLSSLPNATNLKNLFLSSNNFGGYGMGNEVTTSGDVYSYGILLLEMFIGKRPTDNMFNDSLSLHNFVKMALPEQVASVVDPTLIQQREIGEGSSSTENTQNQSSTGNHKITECLISTLNIGIACSQELPRDRPTINHVVTKLLVIRNNFLGTDGVDGGRRARITV
ncbi:unnamed protein product [Camellia sinensis]